MPDLAGADGEEKQMTLVGYGPRDETGGRRRRRRPVATSAGAQASFNLPPAPCRSPRTSRAVPGRPLPGRPLPGRALPGRGGGPCRTACRPGAPPTAARGRPGRPAGADRVLAKPPVRKLAKTLGVDLAGVDADRPERHHLPRGRAVGRRPR